MRTLQQLDSSTSCGVWGTSLRLSAPHAALVNGTLVHGFELDDIHRLGVMHVGAVTLPSLMAVDGNQTGNERSRLSHRRGCRLRDRAARGKVYGRRAHWPRLALRSDRWSVLIGGSGGSAHCGSRRSRRSMRWESPARSLRASWLPSTVPWSYGCTRAGQPKAACTVVCSPPSGFTGIVNVFESDYGGFCTTFSRSHDRFNLAELTSGLGARFETMLVSLKFYSCVSSNHTTLDAIRAIRARRLFSVDEVDHIVVHGSQVTVDHVGWKYRPEGISAAQLNLPFCVATLLLEGECLCRSIHCTEDRRSDPDSAC